MATNDMGGDLYGLWRVSDVHLPRIADVYVDANRAMSTLDASQALSTVTAGSWNQLHDELQRMFGQVGESVLAGAQGVRHAIQAYVATDTASAKSLAAQQSRLVGDQPPAPGSDEAPGTPILPL